MIIVTGTKRSGTSLWMHLLVQAGLPCIGEQFPDGWPALLRQGNPDGFFESELIAGVNFQTNPHPITGAYLAPGPTREHAVKILIPGLVRTDVAFIDRCLATVRDWRSYVVSTRRLSALHEEAMGQAAPEALPPVLQWWTQNFALIRDIAIRGYAAHVVSYDSLLRDPATVVSEVLAWIGTGDPGRVAEIVRATPPGQQDRGWPADAELAAGIEPSHLAVFDALYEVIDAEAPLSQGFIDTLNATEVALRPAVLEYQARLDADAIASVMGR